MSQACQPPPHMHIKCPVPPACPKEREGQVHVCRQAQACPPRLVFPLPTVQFLLGHSSGKASKKAQKKAKAKLGVYNEGKCYLNLSRWGVCGRGGKLPLSPNGI